MYYLNVYNILNLFYVHVFVILLLFFLRNPENPAQYRQRGYDIFHVHICMIRIYNQVNTELFVAHTCTLERPNVFLKMWNVHAKLYNIVVSCCFFFRAC